MRAFRQYWTFSAIRGALSLLASIAIFVVPQAASSIMSVPVLVLLAVDCFATFSIFHGAVSVLLAKLLPASATRGSILYAQATVAVATGALLFFATYGGISLRTVLWIASAQAASAALAEFFIARDTHREYGCLSCYSTAIVLAVSAVCLPFCQNLDATGLSLTLATYVGLYGISELSLGARMLFLEYRAHHPASVASSEWRASMAQPQPAVINPLAAEGCGDCTTCRAGSLCSDYSQEGQITRIMLGHEPALVRSVRALKVMSGAVPNL